MLSPGMLHSRARSTIISIVSNVLAVVCQSSTRNSQGKIPAHPSQSCDFFLIRVDCPACGLLRCPQTLFSASASNDLQYHAGYQHHLTLGCITTLLHVQVYELCIYVVWLTSFVAFSLLLEVEDAEVQAGVTSCGIQAEDPTCLLLASCYVLQLACPHRVSPEDLKCSIMQRT